MPHTKKNKNKKKLSGSVLVVSGVWLQNLVKLVFNWFEAVCVFSWRLLGARLFSVFGSSLISSGLSWAVLASLS